MAKTRAAPAKVTEPTPPKKVADKWAHIENGTAKSASQTVPKTPVTVETTRPRRAVSTKKNKRLSDGLNVKRLSVHPEQNKSNNRKSGVKRAAIDESPKQQPRKNRKINETIILTDSPHRKSIAPLNKGSSILPNVENNDDTLSVFKRNSSRKSEKKRTSESEVYLVEDPEDETLTLVQNGKETTFEKTIVEETDEEDEDEDEMDGLESDEDEDEEEFQALDEETIERLLRNYVDNEAEEGNEDEEIEEEEMEEEEIDEEEMIMNPEDIDHVVPDDMEIDSEGDEDEEDEEESESEVSEMDAESDNEGFISGEDRETTIIQPSKEAKKRHSELAAKNQPIDFDKFPFSDVDSTVTATRAFAYMISSCDVQTFFEKFYQSNVLVVRRKQPTYYGNLFSTERLGELLENNHLEYGVNINIADYNEGVRKTMNGTGRVYPQIVKQHVQSLRSVQFVNPQTFDDRIWYLCEVLQELFGCFVGANTYLTPAGSSGFAPHWDEIDAFLLQVEGRKKWRVWGPESAEDELPLESSGNFTEEDMKDRKPVFEGWIEAGDMLYIPRGFIHQAVTDEKVHSLHVTVSTGRKWSFSDMMEKVVPQAIEWLTAQRPKMRRGLPIGLLDMGGTVDLEYAQNEHFAEKYQMIFDRHLSMLRNFIGDKVTENSVDIMAKEFMRQALPPKLSEEELTYSVVGREVNILDDDLVEFNAKTKIRLIRKHTQRLLMQDEDSCFIAHRLNNSRQFEGRTEQLEDFPIEGVEVFTVIADAYPEWRTLEQVFSSKITSDIARKQQLAAIQRLFQIGVLLVKN